jgi:hypothetical protein
MWPFTSQTTQGDESFDATEKYSRPLALNVFLLPNKLVTNANPDSVRHYLDAMDPGVTGVTYMCNTTAGHVHPREKTPSARPELFTVDSDA